MVEITEAVFSGVPKKHHLNCGFSVVSYHPQTQAEQTFHLLSETPEEMRYWVHGLRSVYSHFIVCGGGITLCACGLHVNF